MSSRPTTASASGAIKVTVENADRHARVLYGGSYKLTFTRKK